MAKMLVNVKIGDYDNKDFTTLIQVELNSIDCLVIKDCMEFCDGDEYETSWNKLITAIERNSNYYLPREWYVLKIESYEYP
jgi:hypothetical protein